MPQISIVADNSTVGNTQRFKAPKNMMYEIYDIHGAVITNGNNQGVWVIPYWVADDINLLAAPREFIAFLVAHIAGQSIDFEFTKTIKAKFITVIRRLDANFTLAIVINFDLVKTSKTDLILEWFRRGL